MNVFASEVRMKDAIKTFTMFHFTWTAKS